MINEKKVLILCPHTDDEITCTGTIAQLFLSQDDKGLTSKCDIKYVAMSGCEDSIPEGWPIDTLRKECHNAMIRLDINDVTVNTFPVRRFPTWRQEILEYLVQLRKDFSPDLVFCPNSYDLHQDHEVISQEAFRAFKYSTILGYEHIQNMRTFNNALFVKLSRTAMATKMSSVLCYKSQMERRERSYMTEESLTGLARLRGAQCLSEFAETFEVIRMII